VNGRDEWAVSLAEVTARPREWLWKPRIPAGELTLIAGIQGIGKSTAIIDMMARITYGRNWPDGVKNISGSVVLLPAEDNLHSTIRPRFDAAMADLERVYIVRGAPSKSKAGKLKAFDLGRDLPYLVNLAQTVKDIRVICIDPIGSYLGDIDVHRENSVRNIMYALRADLAEQFGIAVLGIVHLRKGGADDSALSRILGSVAFTAAARCVWGVAQDEDDPTRKLFIPMKHNLTAKAVAGLEFFIETGRNGEAAIRWGKAIDILAEEVMTDKGMRPQVQREKAKKIIIRVLSKGAVLANEVLGECDAEEISKGTIKAAKKDLKIKSIKRADGKWLWMLPKEKHLLF